MDTIVRAFIEGLSLGSAVRIGEFTVVPLFSKTDEALDYIALRSAIESHSVKVEEVSSSGSVGDLLVTNVGENQVLVLDGEELTGAKQNRILNTTIMLEANKRTVIPVSCTEQGRWAHISSEFASSDSFAPPRLRETAARTVNRSLLENRGFRTSQGEVWEQVSRLAAETGVSSPTGAMNDVMQSRVSQLNQMAANMPPQRGQCGLLAICGGAVLGFDAVSRPTVYAGLHDRLLRSYLMEAGNACTATPAANPEPTVARFLESTFSAEERRFQSPGAGDDYRYSGADLVGSALVVRGHVPHVAFFRIQTGEGRQPGPGLRDYRTRAGFRNRSARHGEPGTSAH